MTEHFSRWSYLWAAVFMLVLLWSGVEPKDRLTWFLEVLPALLGGVVLLFTRVAFPLTPLLYVLILLHCLVLMLGGHYTYAEVPLFDWLREPLGWQRNNYDKLGHFMQGFVPTVIGREVLLRLKVLPRGAWLHFLLVCVALALSATYELIEWWVAVLSEEAAEAFLGTQGYEWDTQSDMAWALIGSLSALLTLTCWHDRQLKSLT